MNHRSKNIFTILLVMVFSLLMANCTDTEDVSGNVSADNVINIGGMDTGDMIAASTVNSRSDDNGSISNVDPTGAENEKWLIQPLKKGFDITYGLFKNNEKSNERVAILKLLGGSPDDYIYNTSTYGYAEYSFKYRNDTDGSPTENPALWYDNGQHYFEGLHVPNRIRYTSNPDELATDQRTINSTTVAAVNNITTDQHDAADTGTDDELGNYTLLSHYLGMPASTHISATVQRIKLPFQHRLARVLVYVLIDPSLGAATKLEGYNYSETKDSEEKTVITPDNPTSTEIRFNNVEVLAGVKDVYDATKKIHTLTPTWVKARKVIPHFVREDGTRNSQAQLIEGYENKFVMYTNIEKKTYVFGTQAQWATINTSYTNKYNSTSGTEAQKVAAAEAATGYRRTDYGKVPLYDIIVRPTYTTLENVMYDEDLTGTTAQALVNHKNSIDFSLKLNTGLEYEKHFEFNLDANYQTAVYLVIDREEVNYNASGAEKWIQQENHDAWYGLDNANGNTLSLAGNSWQRAYTNPASANDIDADGGDIITDGGFYNEATTGEDGTAGQYLSDNTWKKYFAQAYEGGAHHGDYFILTDDITIDAGDLPADFVFTGHLDARDHTITLIGTESWKTSTIDPFNKLRQKKTDAEGNVIDDYEKIPQLYWIKQIAQSKTGGVTDGIHEGSYIKFYMDKATPADITDDMLVFSSEDGVHFTLYTNRYFYKKTGTSLFAGIDGNYTTNQESDNPQTDANGKVIWEANVHKETNSSGSTRWVPTAGWRAEILNTKVKNGTLFPNGYAYPTSGNVRNSYDVSDADKKIKTYSNTPTLPQYK